MNVEKHTVYKIYVSTTDLPYAGTNGNVFIQLFGKKKREKKGDSHITSIKFPLEKSKTNKKKFQQGQTDLFEVEEEYIGKIKKIKIGHDSKGVNSGWHLKKVCIEVPEFDQLGEFLCKKWLNKYESDGKTERELYLTKRDDQVYESESESELHKKENQEEKSQLPKIRYDIKIKTSPFSKIDSELSINMQMFGQRNQKTSLIKLNSTPSDDEREKFRKNNIDLFRLENSDIGLIDKIEIHCANNEMGKASDWFFDEIVINVPSKCLRYFFDKNSRTQVKFGKPWPLIHSFLTLNIFKQSIYYLIEEKDHSVLSVFPISLKSTKDLKVYSADCYTNKLDTSKEVIMKNLKLILYGEFGNSDALKPLNCKSKLHMERYELDEDLFHFHFRKSDIGEIYKIKLIHTHPGGKLKTHFFLRKIQVNYDKNQYVFTHNKWLSTNKDEKKVELKLFNKELKSSRTVSTLSHRLLEQSINDDSYDESFDDNSSRSRSNSNSSLREANKDGRKSSASKRESKYDEDFSDEFDEEKPKSRSSDSKQYKSDLKLKFRDGDDYSFEKSSSRRNRYDDFRDEIDDKFEKKRKNDYKEKTKQSNGSSGRKKSSSLSSISSLSDSLSPSPGRKIVDNRAKYESKPMPSPRKLALGKDEFKLESKRVSPFKPSRLGMLSEEPDNFAEIFTKNKISSTEQPLRPFSSKPKGMKLNFI